MVRGIFHPSLATILERQQTSFSKSYFCKLRALHSSSVFVTVFCTFPKKLKFPPPLLQAVSAASFILSLVSAILGFSPSFPSSSSLQQSYIFHLILGVFLNAQNSLCLVPCTTYTVCSSTMCVSSELDTMSLPVPGLHVLPLPSIAATLGNKS